MADSSVFSRIYDLKTQGLDAVLADVNKVISRFETLGKVKDKISTTSLSDPQTFNQANSQLDKLISQHEEELGLLKQINKATVDNVTATAKLAEMQKGVTVNVQQAAAAMGSNLSASTAGVTKMQASFQQAAMNVDGYSQALLVLADRLALLKDRAAAIPKILEQINEEYGATTISQEEYEQETAKLTAELSQLKTQITEVTGAMTSMNKVYNPALTEEENAALAVNRVELLQRNQLLKLQAVAQEAAAGSINEARAQAALYRKELNALNLSTEEGVARQQELLLIIEELDSFIKTNADMYTRQKINIGNYPTITSEAAALRAEMGRLIVAGEQNSEEFAKLQARAQELAAAMREVNASTKEASTLTDKFGNIVQRMGLRMLANIIIFQAAIELFTELSKKYEEALNRQLATENALIKMNTEAAGTFSESAIKMEAYRARFLDAATSIEDKKEIIRDLNTQFKDQIDHINGVNEAEEFFRSKTDAFIESLQLRAKALGALSAAQELEKQNLINQANHGGNLIDNLDAIGAGIAQTFGVNPALNLYNKAQERLKETTEANKKAINALFQEYIKASNEAAANDRKNGFDTDPDWTEKKSKTKKAHDDTNRDLRIEQELTREIAAEYAKRLQIEAENHKMAAADESRSLTDRLKDYTMYVNRELMAKQTMLDADYQATVIALSKIAGYEAKKEKDRTQQQKDEIAKKALYESKLKTIDAENGLAEIKATEERQKGVADIIKKYYAEQLKDLDQFTAAREAKIEEQYNTEAGQIYNSTLSSKKKDEKLHKLGLDKAVEKDDAELARDHDKEMQISYDLWELQQRADQNARIVALEKELQDELEKIHNKASADRAKLDADTYARDTFDKKKNERIKKQIEEEAINVAQSFANDYMHLLSQEDDYEMSLRQKQINWNKKVSDSQAQSKQDQLKNEAAFNAAQEEMAKEKARKEKARAEAQAIINYAAAALKLWFEADPADVAILEAGLAAQFIATEALLASAPAYAQGTKGHPGGLAWIGDGGEPELLKLGNKFAISPSTATLVNLPKGTSVTPFSQINNVYNGSMGTHLHAPSFSPAMSGGVGPDFGALHTSIGQLYSAVARMSHIDVVLDTPGLGRKMNSNNYKTVSL